MSDLEMIKMLLDFGAPTIICIFTIKVLGVRVEELTKKIDECLTKMDRRLEKVETAIENLERRV